MAMIWNKECAKHKQKYNLFWIVNLLFSLLVMKKGKFFKSLDLI